MPTLTGRTVYVRYSHEPVARTLDADTDQSDAQIRVDLDENGQLVGVQHTGIIGIDAP